MSIKKFTIDFEIINEEEVDITEMDELEERISDLEQRIYEEIDIATPREENQLNVLLKKINYFKKENDFYDAAAELDAMYPNRNEDDFDEDSLTYENTFGKD